MPNRLDHLVIAGTDLAALVAWWTRSTGTEPSPGGSHVGWGTRNVLVGVDPQTYIELIAPDPEQPEPDRTRPFGIDEMEPMSITLATSALAVDDLVAACALVRHVGLNPGPIRPMSRQLADGASLHWRLAIPPFAGHRGAQPFLIEWGSGQPHPAAALPPLVSLVELSIVHPRPQPLRRLLEVLGVVLKVEHGSRPAVAATIEAPGGRFLRV